MSTIKGIIEYLFQQCQESRPFPCANCIGRNMVCEYPSNEKAHDRSQRQDNASSLVSGAITSTPEPESLSSSIELSSLSSGFPVTFTVDDMRFFHHFLVFAHPHLPFGSEESWKTLLPVHAQEVWALIYFPRNYMQLSIRIVPTFDARHSLFRSYSPVINHP